MTASEKTGVADAVATEPTAVVWPATGWFEGRYAGREAFRQLLRDSLAMAARAGVSELILSDPDFSDWPLGERAVAAALNEWALASARCKVTLLAASYDEVVRRHALFVQWRVRWSHKIECRQWSESDPQDVPSLLWTPHWALRRDDLDRCTGLGQRRSAFTCGVAPTSSPGTPKAKVLQSVLMCGIAPTDRRMVTPQHGWFRRRCWGCECGECQSYPETITQTCSCLMGVRNAESPCCMRLLRSDTSPTAEMTSTGSRARASAGTSCMKAKSVRRCYNFPLSGKHAQSADVRLRGLPDPGFSGYFFQHLITVLFISKRNLK